MPKVKRADHYWNTIRTDITIDAAGVLNEVEIVTGVGPDTEKVMLIKKIAFAHDNLAADGAQINTGDNIGVEICLNNKQGETSIPRLTDSGTIYYHNETHEFGGDGATATEAPGVVSQETGFPSFVEFDDPVPVIDTVISLYCDRIGNIALASDIAAYFKIWYKVEDIDFKDALMILESYR